MSRTSVDPHLRVQRHPERGRYDRASIEAILDEGLVEHSRRLGGLMLDELTRWEREIPIVRRARGRGLLLGMSLVHPDTGAPLAKTETRWIFDTLLRRGVLAMIYNPEVRLNPPLVIREAEAMEALAIMKEVLLEAAERARG